MIYKSRQCAIIVRIKHKFYHKINRKRLDLIAFVIHYIRNQLIQIFPEWNFCSIFQAHKHHNQLYGLSLLCDHFMIRLLFAWCRNAFNYSRSSRSVYLLNPYANGMRASQHSPVYPQTYGSVSNVTIHKCVRALPPHALTHILWHNVHVAHNSIWTQMKWLWSWFSLSAFYYFYLLDSCITVKDSGKKTDNEYKTSGNEKR